MSKVLFISRYNNSFLSQALVGDNKILEFGVGGRFIAERPLSYNLGSFVEVDIISILAQNGFIEVSTNINGVFTKWDCDLQLMKLVNKFNTFKNKVFMGTIQSAVDNVKYTQYIFAYSAGSLGNNQMIIEELRK